MIFSYSDRSVIAFFRSSFRALGRAVPMLVLAGCTLAAALAPLPGIGAAAPTILVVGDSISSAYGLPSGQGWVDLLQRKLTNEGFAYRVVNASITGDTTAGGRSRIGAALQAHKPEIVIIELGGNDGLRGAALAPVRAN